MVVTGIVPDPVPGAVPAPRPSYLHAPELDAPVFGMFHPTRDVADTAVLFLPPFGYDDMCAHRGLRTWALALAAEGIASLRVDLPGSGDSGGGPRDRGRAASWPLAAAAAASWLRAESGARRVVALGIGLGGLVAGQALADGARIDDLVLWATPARGRTLVRELRAFARLGLARGDAFDWPAGTPPLPEGAIESGGFLLSAESVAWLGGVDLAAALPAATAGRHMLLLGREGIGVDARLEQALREGPGAVTVAEGPGFTELMDEPHRSSAPLATMTAVSRWLRETGSAPRPAPRPALAPVPVTATDEAELHIDGATIRETPIAIPAPAHGGSLFGIVARPTEGAAAGVTAVLLNVGAERRIGINRMWVEAARRWAARGVPSVRLDLNGIGDGGGEPSPWSRDYALYREAVVEQVAIALDALPALGLPARFHVVGVCSGAYWAFACARRDPRIVGLDLLTARMLLFDDTEGSAAEVRHLRRLTHGEVWRDILAGKLTFERAARMIRAIAVMAAKLPRRIAERVRARAVGGDPLDRALDGLRDQGTEVRLRFVEGEPLRDELERTGHLGRLERWPNVAVDPLPGPRDAHTLQVVRMQPGAHAALDAFLVAQLERLDAAAVPGAARAPAAESASA